ncbi:MAG: hypothetical protein ACXW5U_05515 [Thermoanaerobaculia bacterium]
MNRFLTLALGVVAVALSIAPAAAQVPGGAQPQAPKKRMWCRDPAAQSLTFQIISRGAHRTEGRIRITGVVKNVGDAVFQSDPRQANVALYETSPGARGTVRAQQGIARLEPNHTITLDFERDWSISTEFPPTYSLLITYDPDIYIDANKNNDDCNRNNNKKELTGAEINRQWQLRDSVKKP